jgi:hypothetical protein
MSKKIVWKVLPLQRVVAEPITDPAEQAAIDKAILARKKRSRSRKRIEWHVAPLQHAVVEIVTDPAEQAAIDRAIKRARQKRSRRGKRAATRAKAKKNG